MTTRIETSQDPLGFIQRCVKRRRILWTHHVNMRLRERFIPREAILEAVGGYEIIESYPEDKYLPSYLVFARHAGIVFHILFALDVQEENVRLVTAYRPNPAEWSADLKRRIKP